MEHLLTLAVTVFMGFFAIMNPIANTAVFVGLTSGLAKDEKLKIAFKSIFLTFCIIAVFSVLGKGIFELFGITLPALRITGGILVFLVGYHMLHGDNSKMHHPESVANDIAEDDSDLAVSPLAVPILAGPGTIATAMNFSASGGVLNITVTLSMFALLCLLTFLCFISGQKIINVIGSNGISIITRLMGLILAVIGTQMLIQGVHDAIKLFYVAS